MKHFILMASTLFASSYIFGESETNLRKECAPIYAENCEKILSQFRKPITVEQSNAYKGITLRKGCDAIYTEDIEHILTQFMHNSTPNERKDYKKFMLLIKLRNDLLFKLTAFEQTIKSEERALLRTPLTNYTACRSHVGVAFGYEFQTANPSKKVLSPCETSYAAQMQQVLNSVRKLVSKRTLKRYESFMLMLKYYEDLGAMLNEFERKTNYTIRTRLREPLVKYLNCRNSLILRHVQAVPQ